MKELSIEQKAIAYDKAIERAKSYYNATENNSLAPYLEIIFPELKESGDERIRSLIIDLVNARANCNDVEPMIAWLEKQDPCHTCDHAVLSCNDFPCEKKQAEQNPADKFKVGDYIKHNKANITCKIISVNSGSYYVENIETSGRFELFDAEQNFHLWTIEDAKDGDVLEFGDHRKLVIGIVSYINKKTGKVDVYCMLEDNNFKVGIYYALDTINPHPATKEQRDQFEKVMADAGYTFDFNKKKLKKIEQRLANQLTPEQASILDKHIDRLLNPAWNEEDDKIQNDLIWIIEAYRKNGFNKGHFETANRAENWLKSLKDKIQSQPKQEWKQENIGDLTDFENAMMHIGGSFFGDNAGLDPNDTNAIREQANLLLGLVPKREWSEEDKDYYDAIIAKLEVTQEDAALTDNQMEFLKSLRPQNRWKPSDEQMWALSTLANIPESASDTCKKNAQELLEQLKKLKE